MSTPLRCVIVEDEAPARRILEHYISRVPSLTLAGSYSQPLEALPLLQDQGADLLLLDINMPGLTGVDFLRSLPEGSRLLTLLTTAYSEYAIEAFELGVFDYLVKPIAFERFLHAINRAAAALQAGLQTYTATAQPTHTVLKSAGKQYRIAYAEILYVQGLREYVIVHVGQRQLIVHAGMGEMAALLPQNRFLRVHKSFIINLDHVQYRDGNQLQLSSQTQVPIGQTYREAVDAVFG